MIIGEVWEFITLFSLLSCTFENFCNTKLFLKTLESVLQIKSHTIIEKKDKVFLQKSGEGYELLVLHPSAWEPLKCLRGTWFKNCCIWSNSLSSPQAPYFRSWPPSHSWPVYKNTHCTHSRCNHLHPPPQAVIFLVFTLTSLLPLFLMPWTW